MAKTLVIDTDATDRAPVPFLRGILTRCLQDTGLTFEDAYHVASEVRDDLAHVAEITVDELREVVASHLDEFPAHVLERYRRSIASGPMVTVIHSDGHTSPYSRGRHRSTLESCGVPGEEAGRIASELYREFAHHGQVDVPVRDLQHATYERLTNDIGDDAARRYLVWEEYRHSDRPLLVLIGGATGTGKSTIATRIAHQLDIVRTQSTDMLREVMRMMVPERVAPALHASSFEAWKALPVGGPEEDPDARLVNGYLTQAELLSVACEAVVQRAGRERVSLILEGVHIHPSILEEVTRRSEAMVVRIMLAVLKPKELRRRIRGRGKQAPDRRAKRYLEHFDAIWGVQSFLLSEADRVQVQIVQNDEIDRTVSDVMVPIVDELSTSFSGTPEEVFA